MKILGIDPGYDRLGVAIIEKPLKGKEIVVYSDCFMTCRTDSIYERLTQVGTEVERLISTFKPDVVALETLFVTKNQKTAMHVAEARGIIIYAASKENIPVAEYSPMQIKMAVTGDGTSDKQRIIRMLGLLVALPKKKAVDDEYDAIAVALTHSALSTSPRYCKKTNI